jgi:hypothetical protein
MKSFFQKLADGLSFVLTTWQNFIVWVLLIAAWIIAGPWVASHNFLPAWFTSNAFNFPLNTVTTLAELYIGFLLGVNAARIQKQQDEHVTNMKQQIDHMKNELDIIVDTIAPEQPH